MSLQSFVNSASNAEVIAGMKKIKTSIIPNGSLLDNANPLGVNAADAIVNYFKPSPTRFSQDDARTFLAAASFVHCKDGWQYLSHAVDCIFKGDFKTAVHLAYYAELRAAMSFLASEGIGILNNVHFCIDASSTIIKDPKSSWNVSRRKFDGWGTHRFIWECLNAFVSSSRKDISHSVKTFWHNGNSFEDWIRNIPGANSLSVISQIIKQWITDWSFDIGHFKDDREGRNNASYAASKFKSFSNTDCMVSIETYSDALKLLEPSSINRFSLLDKHLFKILFLKIHSEINARGTIVSASDLLDRTFANARKSIDASLKAIVLSTTDHPIIDASKDTLQDTSGNIKPFTIFSRALLLLRISAGSNAHLLNEAGITKTELGFFFNYCCVEHGFWNPGTTVTDYTDLWADIFDAMTDIDAWAVTQSSPIYLWSFNNAQSDNLTFYKHQLRFRMHSSRMCVYLG